MPDIFEPIFVGTTLERAVIDTLVAWMPTYLQEVELQLGRTRGQIPLPRTYTTRNEIEGFPDDSLPLCVVVSSGLAEPPTKEGDGTYSAWFSIGVGFAASAADADASGLMAKIYAAAGRAILLQQGSLGGVAHGIEWVDESYDDLVAAEERVVRAAFLIFRINVWDIVSKSAGPTGPPPDPVTQPGSQWPTADTVDIKINVVR